MPGAIGALVFTSWAGIFQAPAVTVTTYGRAGTAGTGMQISAARGVPVSVQTTLADTLANCITHRNSAEALIGTVVSSTDALGRVYTGTGVLSCRTAIVAAKGLGGLLTHLCMCEWELMPETA